MIILNEREHAENCLKNGFVDTKPFNTLSILAKYYYHYCGFRKKKIIALLIDYLSKYYPRYELNEFSWQTSVEKIASNAGRYKLYEIQGIKITESEMNTIKGINNKVLERLMFTMLCLAKLGNAKNQKNNGWVNTDSKDIFNYARISCRVNEREIKIGKLWQMGLLEFSKRNDNLNCRVTFIDDNSNEVLFISDFRELGYEYLMYNGGNFIRCADCGILSRGNKTGTKKYCRNCTTYTPVQTKSIKCIDCGKVFDVNSKNNKTCRCNECQTVRNINLNRVASKERMRKYRASQTD